MGNSATVCKMSEGNADIALIGLAVMGQNLILNMNDNGFKVVAYNRTTAKVDDFLKNEAKNTDVVGAHSLEEMVAKLKKPRRVMMLVKAGADIYAFIQKLVPLLEKATLSLMVATPSTKTQSGGSRILRRKDSCLQDLVPLEEKRVPSMVHL